MTPMQIARTRLLMRNPFYGTLLMLTPLVEDRSVPVAATDMERIYWNPDTFAMLSVDSIMFVLAHEIMHIVFLHGMRRYTRQADKWNVACDYAINAILLENGFVMPPAPHTGLHNDAWKGMSAETIYARLPPSRQRNGGTLAGDLRPPSATASPEATRGKVAQAATAARMAGRLPAGLEALISQMLNPQVAWAELLRRYMTERSPTRQDWSRPNRRFPTIHLPTRTGRRIGTIGIINDTSGSVGQDIRDAFAAEVQAVAETTGANRVHVRHADVKTQAEQWFECGEPIVLRPRGGGGTDMRVPLAEFEAEREDIECVVMLTDGMTPWPQTEPLVPLIVCCTTDVMVPVGNVVRITV